MRQRWVLKVIFYFSWMYTHPSQDHAQNREAPVEPSSPLPALWASLQVLSHPLLCYAQDISGFVALTTGDKIEPLFFQNHLASLQRVCFSGMSNNQASQWLLPPLHIFFLLLEMGFRILSSKANRCWLFWGWVELRRFLPERSPALRSTMLVLCLLWNLVPTVPTGVCRTFSLGPGDKALLRGLLRQCREMCDMSD